MPRNHNPGTSTLRNRNRITNKTRLKIHLGTIDADPLILDEETFVSNSIQTAGVDAEETNEHHLQAVLSAASQRNQQPSRPTRSGDKSLSPKVAYIPVPDSTGIVDNYEELYPPGRWKDPATNLATSITVEECCTNALANGFTYYMDERDKDWLDKNNEEARGEGTSVQGSLISGATRVSARSAKAKGKEPESCQAMTITEDEFELVMGLFETITHEKTEFLHHSLETGMAFPAFTEYQDTFSSQLSPSVFAPFTVPPWIPAPPQLLRIARAIYPYWRERRIERGGHRIIPTLNGDETDTLNESYVCFRRREIKAVRKTRASQVTSSDKLARLQSEMSYPLELAKSILTRENLKKEDAQQAQAVWEKRLALVDLKRKFSPLGDKPDEELLFDKERIVKKPKVEQPRLGLKLRHNDISSSAAPAEQALNPSQRHAILQSQIERELSRQKDRDHHWEDLVDNVYQPLPTSFASRLFKYIPLPDFPAWPSSGADSNGEQSTRQPRSVRLRYSRGGRLLIDRRQTTPSSRVDRGRVKASLPTLVSKRRQQADDDESSEDEEHLRRLAERWRLDVDDLPNFGPQGNDEQDRVLVDDYDPKYLRQTMTLLTDPDQANLMTDPTIIITNTDGRQQPIVPFRLGMPAYIRRDAQGRPIPAGVPTPALPSGQQVSVPVASAPGVLNGTPVSVPVKKMQPPVSVPQMRISSNGGMRPLGPSPAVPSMPTTMPVPHSSPPHTNTTQQPSLPNGVNGVNRGAINMPHLDAVKSEINTSSVLLNGVSQALQQTLSEAQQNADSNNINQVGNQLSTPLRPKSQNQHMNGYHLPTAQVFAAATANLPNGTFPHQQNLQLTGLSHQQVQNLKSAFANIPVTQDITSIQSGRGVPYTQLASGSSFNIQLSAAANKLANVGGARNIGWNGQIPIQRPTSGMGNNVDPGPLNGSLSPSPGISHSVPARSPSANGSRAGIRNGATVVGHVMGNNPAHSLSPLQHSPPPLPLISQSHSPRPSQTPIPSLSSPSMQHQQAVGSSQGGY